MKVLGDRVLVRMLPPDEKAGTHIYYAPQHRPEQQIHVVVAVGTGRKLKNGTTVDIPLRAGDRVLLDQYALNERTQAGEDLWIIPFKALSLAVEV